MPSYMSHTHEQAVAATEWTVVHNLGTIAPVVDVFIDVDGKKMKILPGGIEVIDNRTLKVHFSAPRSGTAAVR